ncbi:MAG: hypothetical protein R3F14_44010 [Polyangiaceae bacterium]
MKIYRELGERVDRAFERAGRDVRSFARIAADALHDAHIPERSGPDDVLAWVFAASELPPQNDLAEAFGEPPITVYRGRDFHVEVLFWLRTVTTVHGHGFSGAFQALSGERLQTRHAFVPATQAEAAAKAEVAPNAETAAPAEVLTGEVRHLGGEVLTGEVRHLGGEVLTPGDVVEINRDLVHAVVHLEEPSATIVVRTGSDPDAGPQLDLRAPWLAHDPFHTAEARLRKVQALRLLCQTDEPRALARAVDLLARADLATTLDVLDLTYRTFGTEAHIAPLLDAARAHHGPALTAKLLDVLREDRRLRAAQSLRRTTPDPSARFFLALLHHVPTRDDMLPLIAARFPGADPIGLIERFLDDVSGTSRAGVDTADPLTRALLHAMLRADTPEAIRRHLARTFDRRQIEARAPDLDRHADRIRNTVLGPLFRTRAPRAPTGDRP